MPTIITCFTFLIILTFLTIHNILAITAIFTIKIIIRSQHTHHNHQPCQLFFPLLPL